MPNTIRITVTGDVPWSGKTTVTAVIAKALHAHGFDDLLVVNQDGDFFARLHDLPGITDLPELPHVVIEDLNGNAEEAAHPQFTLKGGATDQ